MKTKKNKFIEIIFFIIIFLFFFIFFSKVHPIILFDTDDWYNSIFTRSAIPIIGEWNPTKILPEILMPFVVTYGNYFMSLFSNNFIYNIIYVNSFVISIFITIYISLFYKIIKKRNEDHLVANILITIIFVIFHFLIFRSRKEDSYYMFHAMDMSCYYHYLIPVLLNSSLVLFYLNNDSFIYKDSKIKTSFMLLILYLSMFSNIYSNIVLSTFIGVTLLYRIIDSKLLKKKNFKKKNILKFLKNNTIEISIVIVWIITQILEYGGGRAKVLMHNESLKNIFMKLGTVFSRLNTSFIIVLVLCLIVGIIFFIKNKLYKNRKVVTCILSMILTFIYIILLTTKTGAKYIERMDILFGFIFFIFVFICFTILLIIKKYDKLLFWLPLITIILFFETSSLRTSSNNIYPKYRESNLFNTPHDVCIEIEELIMDQIKENEDKPGSTIYIPYTTADYNWPIIKDDAYRITYGMYKQGLIKNYVEFEYVISKEFYDDKIE